MGRKIPGRKHRGVRDPEKQRAQRLEAQKVNAPPSNVDEQPVPKSAMRIAELMNKVNRQKSPKVVQKKKKGDKNKDKKLIIIKSKVGKNEKTVPKFEQKKGESGRAFLNRCHKICETVIHEVEFESKFGVQVKRNEKTGAIEGTVKQGEDPLKKMIKEAKKEAKKKPKKKKKGDEAVKLTKSEKRKLKLKIKKDKKKEMSTDESQFERTDKVAFGEVYHAPPELSLPRNVTKTNEISKPGRKNLLLKAVINGETVQKNSVSKSESALRKVSTKTINKRGKLKDLPMKVRSQLEKQQKEIIEAYKLLKAEKRKNAN